MCWFEVSYTDCKHEPNNIRSEEMHQVSWDSRMRPSRREEGVDPSCNPCKREADEPKGQDKAVVRNANKDPLLQLFTWNPYSTMYIRCHALQQRLCEAMAMVPGMPHRRLHRVVRIPLVAPLHQVNGALFTVPCGLRQCHLGPMDIVIKQRLRAI